MPRTPKVLIANDGYKVKRRSRVGERVYETVNAKCVIRDPEDEAHIGGVIHLQQGPKADKTAIWGEVWNLGYDKYELSINALGDLRDGCESTGGVFNPHVSESGYGYNKKMIPAPGKLGQIASAQHGAANVDRVADVDLSGTQSIIGRSMVITRPGGKDAHGNDTPASRVACCTIGLAAGKPKQTYANDYGYGSYSQPQKKAPAKKPVYNNYGYAPQYQPAVHNNSFGGFGFAGKGHGKQKQSYNNFW